MARARALRAGGSYVIRDKNPRLPLAAFQAAMQLGRESVDPDEIEAVAVSLLHQKYVKAYVSHERQTLVLSKLNAFPPLSRHL